MNQKVAIYCRLSEEDKNKRNDTDDSESIQNQKNMLIEHAQRNHWEIYEIYSDDDYAGADRKRPAFKHLLSDAQARKFNVVLCKTQSRFTREMELVESTYTAFSLYGAFALSALSTTRIPIIGATKKAVRSTVLLTNGILKTCPKTSKAYWKANSGKDCISAPLPYTVI